MPVSIKTKYTHWECQSHVPDKSGHRYRSCMLHPALGPHRVGGGLRRIYFNHMSFRSPKQRFLYQKHSIFATIMTIENVVYGDRKRYFDMN